MPSVDTSVQSAATQTDDEWTFVKPKKYRNGRQKAPRQPPAHITNRKNQLERDESTLNSPEDIAGEYRRVRSQYEQDAACAALKQLVREMNSKPINRAVCLGIGTFDPPDGGWETKRRTYLQLAAFMVMVQVLEEQREDDTIECIFQEPLFTKTDRAFLESLHPKVKVVDSPEGFNVVDQSTLLYGVHLYRPIYAMALEKSAPCIFVGTSLDIWDTVTFGQATDFLDNPIVKSIESTYWKRQFPAGETTAFSSTSIYWLGENDSNPQPSEPQVDGEISDLEEMVGGTSIHDRKNGSPSGRDTGDTS